MYYLLAPRSQASTLELRKTSAKRTSTLHQFCLKVKMEATVLSLGQVWLYLLPVLFILYGIHGTTRFGIQHEVEASVFTEATGVAKEGILFIIIDGPEEPKCLGELGRVRGP